jgi:two-component system sensor histidine kinase RegB
MVGAVFAIVTVLHEAICHVAPGSFWPDPDERRIDLLVGGVVCVFVYFMARSSRAHEALLVAARERYSRDRQTAALDTLAASVVHQLASPLATMAVAVGELRNALGGRHPAALDVLETQVRACKAISSQVLATTGEGRAEGGARISADRFLAAIVEKYALMHPWTEVECRHEGTQPVPEILAEAALEEALLVVLLGLSGARRGIRVAHRWDGARLTLHICDGEPIRPDEHPDFILAKSTIGRFGGTISAVPEPDGRSCVEVSLPLDRLAIQR